MLRGHAAFLVGRLQGPHKLTLATGVNWLKVKAPSHFKFKNQ